MTFKTKTGFYLKLLTPETMKLLGNTKSNITKDENGENMSRLEITEVVIIHCNIVKNNYQKISRVFIFFLIIHLGNYQIFHQGNLYAQKLLTQNFHILKYGLQVKILNHLRYKIK